MLRVFQEKDEEEVKELVFEIFNGAMRSINSKWREFFLNYREFQSLFSPLKTPKTPKSLVLSCVQFFKILLCSKVISLIFQGFSG